MTQPTPEWAATVRPGDTLMLSFTDEITKDQCDEIRRGLGKVIPGVIVVFVFRCSGMAVRHAGDNPEPTDGVA
jgi:hypothetical protein